MPQTWHKQLLAAAKRLQSRLRLLAASDQTVWRWQAHKLLQGAKPVFSTTAAGLASLP